MAVLVCPRCHTVHRVSILQTGYRRLPCRRCRQPIPLTADSEVEPPPSPESSPESSDALLATLMGIKLERPVDHGTAPHDEPSGRAAPPSPAAAHVCRHCRAELQPGAVKCPHCRRFQPGGRRPDAALTRGLWWGIGVALAAITLLAVLLFLRADRPV